jgi:hypothetical protein
MNNRCDDNKTKSLRESSCDIPTFTKKKRFLILIQISKRTKCRNIENVIITQPTNSVAKVAFRSEKQNPTKLQVWQNSVDATSRAGRFDLVLVTVAQLGTSTGKQIWNGIFAEVLENKKLKYLNLSFIAIKIMQHAAGSFNLILILLTLLQRQH